MVREPFPGNRNEFNAKTPGRIHLRAGRYGGQEGAKF
jgi:hypothetical protein